MPILVAARSKVCVNSLSLLGLRVRIPLEAGTFFSLSVLCCQGERFLRRTDHLSRGVLPSMRVRFVCVCVCVCDQMQQ